MTRRLLVHVAAALCVAAMCVGMPGFSSASFTARTVNTGAVTSAADWTPPTVALQNPGTPLKGTVPLTATASDAESGISTVQVQYLPPTGTEWVTVCTATGAQNAVDRIFDAFTRLFVNNVKYGFEGFTLRRREVPTGEVFSDGVQKGDVPIAVGDDDAIANARQRNA